jgi:hypothetical protein
MSEKENAGIPLTLPDAFTSLQNLLALIADPAAAKKRLTDIQLALAAVERAKADLVAARSGHDAQVAREHAEIEAGRQKNAKLFAELSRRADALDARADQYRQLVNKTIA